jgi:hypothetical protein
MLITARSRASGIAFRNLDRPPKNAEPDPARIKVDTCLEL